MRVVGSVALVVVLFVGCFADDDDDKWQLFWLLLGDKLDHLDPQAAIQFVAELKETGQLFYPLIGIFPRVKLSDAKI